MNSKTLTGILLIIGSIIMAITIFAGFPGNSGNEDWVTADYEFLREVIIARQLLLISEPEVSSEQYDNAFYDYVKEMTEIIEIDNDDMLNFD